MGLVEWTWIIVTAIAIGLNIAMPLNENPRWVVVFFTTWALILLATVLLC